MHIKQLAKYLNHKLINKSILKYVCVLMLRTRRVHQIMGRTSPFEDAHL